jgi:hypothetical protein
MPFTDLSLPELLELLPTETVRQLDEESWRVPELGDDVMQVVRHYSNERECRISVSFRPDGDLQAAIECWTAGGLVGRRALSAPPKNIANLMDVVLGFVPELMDS